MPKGYLIDGEEPRNIKEIYVGVDGKARRIIRGWVGVNGVARLLARKPGVLTLSKDSIPLASNGILTIPFTTTISILSASGTVSVSVDHPDISASVSGNTITLTVNTTAYKNSVLTVSVAENVEYSAYSMQIPIYIPTGTIYRQYGTFTENLHDYTCPEQHFTIGLNTSGFYDYDSDALAQFLAMGKYIIEPEVTIPSQLNIYNGGDTHAYKSYFDGSTDIDGVRYYVYHFIATREDPVYGDIATYSVVFSYSDRIPRKGNESALSRWRIEEFINNSNKAEVKIKQFAYTYGYVWAADPVGDLWTKGSMTYVTSANNPEDGAYFSWTAA